jgi:hypothetical protein
MPNDKNEVLNDLYDFLNQNHFQLMEEWQRVKSAYKQKMTFPAFCVAFYSRLNETEDDDRE